MKLSYYLREAWLPAAYMTAFAAITDIVLLTCTGSGISAGDIIYLNILLLVTAGIFGIIGAFRLRTKYMPLRCALDRHEDIDYLLPQDNSTGSGILRDAVRFKNSDCAGNIEKYRKNIEELSDYITKWAHEIKIPVSVCDLILENSDGGVCNSQDLKPELERVKFLINQVLYAGRASSYSEDLSVCEFDLSAAVNDAVRRNAVFFIRKNIEIITDIPDYTVINDEKWVTYILEQILNNASKYTRQNGKVEIGAGSDNKAVRLTIRDNGIGIAPQDIGRVFDRGFTGINGRMTAKSTGMGLYYSKMMADRLGIGLEVSSARGEYTEFTIVFYKMHDYISCKNDFDKEQLNFCSKQL